MKTIYQWEPSDIKDGTRLEYSLGTNRFLNKAVICSKVESGIKTYCLADFEGHFRLFASNDELADELTRLNARVSL